MTYEKSVMTNADIYIGLDDPSPAKITEVVFLQRPELNRVYYGAIRKVLNSLYTIREENKTLWAYYIL